MNKDVLKELFSQAAEIAESVPKDLREAAFNRALDALLGSQKTNIASRSGRTEIARAKQDVVDEDHVSVLLSELDRTQYPEITSAPRVLERALFLLRAVRDNHSVDGLGASQIAKIITDKFRMRTSRQAVTQALDAAGDKVDKKIRGNKTTYHLMEPGYEYLEKGDFSINAPQRKTAQKSKQKNAASQGEIEETVKGEKRGHGSSRPGPGAMLKALVESGFFSERRSIVDIKQYCEKNLAHIYALNELSTPLRRAVHNGLLKREQNSDGQYEYIAQ
jgi:hypothetical protein